MLREDRLSPEILRLTLDRPDALNAIDSETAQRFEAVVHRAEADAATRVVILTGAGERAFCSGADLKEAHERKASHSTGPGGFCGLVFAPRTKPWIAAVNGIAAGGGCELALACDVILAADSARFSLPEAQRGILAAGGGAFRIARRLPPGLALEFLLSGEAMSAPDALAYGLVDRLVPAPDLAGAAVALAERLASAAPMAAAAALRLVHAATRMDEEALIAMTREEKRRLFRSQDCREGIAAFVQRRKPRWTGT
ncbi:enoyl-CoA hydratase/isomerase family protein [Paracoccus pantotrophus]|uniref:enoyl-CoA hydratase/isomerase family protein n=1 Tax=Paracoccus pantotrophus TaxID=82367 RepID=UPI000491F160|nr:enoyl-CoA hydratase-related protein [Paracoccus pantotrophus]